MRLSTTLAWVFSALVFEPFGSHFCPLRRQFLAMVGLCFRCSPRGCRGFLCRLWDDFGIAFFVLSRCFVFRLKMLSSALSWLFVAYFWTYF